MVVFGLSKGSHCLASRSISCLMNLLAFADLPVSFKLTDVMSIAGPANCRSTHTILVSVGSRLSRLPADMMYTGASRVLQISADLVDGHLSCDDSNR